MNSNQTSNVYTIELACDHVEADDFAAWLMQRGHSVSIGKTTRSFIDGYATSENDALDYLWIEYCNSAS